MEPTKRILVNTIVQYLRAIIYTILSLVATRFILRALGQSDFGLYSVIGSIVTMLGFIVTSLAGSTQRFLSVTRGKENNEELSKIFGNAFFIHLVLALLLAFFLIALAPHVLHYLHIPDGRSEAAAFVYWMVIIMLTLSFITSPIRALFIARENIIYVSLVEVIDAVFRLIGAVALIYIPYDSLWLYAIIMTIISIINFIAYALYAFAKYPECHIPRWEELDKSYIIQMSNFAIWNVYATGATVVRTQGLAVIINRFWGTLVNAAYGIALQVSNAVSFIASSILTAINPQLMKAEGAHDRAKMWILTEMECKYSFIAMSILLIPMIFEMPGILQAWLVDVPACANEFCCGILIAVIIDQSTIGLTTANQAIGKIKVYTILNGTLRLSVLVFAWIYAHLGNSPWGIMGIYIAVEAITAWIRIPYMHITSGLDVPHFLHTVYGGSIIPICTSAIISWILILTITPFAGRFLLTICIGGGVGLATTYLFSLNNNEKAWLKNNIQQILHRK